MKVSELAQKLDLTLEEIKLILTAQRVKNVTEETEVPEAIATRILGTHKNVISLPQLQQATFMREPVGGQEELQEEFPGNNTEQGLEEETSGELTLSQVKSIAQAQKVSKKTVIAMVEALREREVRVLLLEAYQRKQQDLQIGELGEAIATMEFYNAKQTELDKRVNGINEGALNFNDLTQDVFGLNLETLDKAMKQSEVNRCSRTSTQEQAANLSIEGKTEEEIKQILGKEVQTDFLTLARHNLLEFQTSLVESSNVTA